MIKKRAVGVVLGRMIHCDYCHCFEIYFVSAVGVVLGRMIHCDKCVFSSWISDELVGVVLGRMIHCDDKSSLRRVAIM